jgi:hypothetical protein
MHVEKDQVGGLEDKIREGRVIVGTRVKGGRDRDQEVPVRWTTDESRAIVGELC